MAKAKSGRPKGFKERIGPWLAKREIMKGMGVKPNDVVVLDVGAYEGSYIEYYRRMWPNATYHCFEPLPGKVDEMRTKFAAFLDKTIHIHQMALSDKVADDVPFFVGGRDGEMSSLDDRPASKRRYFRFLLEASKTPVQVSTIDAQVKELGIKRVNLIKLDVHGAEGRIIDGARQTLRYKKPEILYIETFFIPMYGDGPMFWQLCAQLDKMGYSLFDLYLVTRSFVNRQVKYADALFVHKGVRPKYLDKFPEEWLQKSLRHAMGHGS